LNADRKRLCPLLILAAATLGCSSIRRTAEPSAAAPTQTTAPTERRTVALPKTATAAASATSSQTPTITPEGVFAFEVPADVVWFNTRLALKAGQYVEIRASGKSNISGVPGHDDWGPDGDGGYCPADCLLPGAGYGTLIGKYPGGLPFRIGSRFESEIESDAVLLLAINDNEPYYWDNTGSYAVRIIIFGRKPGG
jgi:hypothetical protein